MSFTLSFIKILYFIFVNVLTLYMCVKGSDLINGEYIVELYRLDCSSLWDVV